MKRGCKGSQLEELPIASTAIQKLTLKTLDFAVSLFSLQRCQISLPPSVRMPQQTLHEAFFIIYAIYHSSVRRIQGRRPHNSQRQKSSNGSSMDQASTVQIDRISHMFTQTIDPLFYLTHLPKPSSSFFMAPILDDDDRNFDTIHTEEKKSNSNLRSQEILLKRNNSQRQPHCRGSNRYLITIYIYTQRLRNSDMIKSKSIYFCIVSSKSNHTNCKLGSSNIAIYVPAFILNLHLPLNPTNISSTHAVAPTTYNFSIFSTNISNSSETAAAGSSFILSSRVSESSNRRATNKVVKRSMDITARNISRPEPSVAKILLQSSRFDLKIAVYSSSPTKASISLRVRSSSSGSCSLSMSSSETSLFKVSVE
ncbi:unnamed protein product [Callosobruchus maculatus]|uniref:Uncharacterized protein n=1 Tax=Callosobruchus maculatus TaxID=64391 RepID=A0A653CXB2_CALMS|nr:unnamed protein product [Callosobruchus maculatus]